MEGLTLAAEIFLLLVVTMGLVFYAARAITAPVKRLLDWLFHDTTD